MNARMAIAAALVVSCLSPAPAAAARFRAPARSHAPATPPGIAGPAALTGVPDGAGGVYIAFSEYRDGSSDLFLLRVTNAGAVAAGWPADGVPVCTAPGEQVESVLLPDNANGVIVAWLDFRDDLVIPDGYAQRVNPSGTPQWTANGVKVLDGLQVEDTAVAPDGAGGLLVAWSAIGAVDRDVYAIRFTGAGALATGWGAAGTLVCGLAEDQVAVDVTRDDAGGAIVAWEDARAGGGLTNIYAQRLNASGVAQWGANGVQLDASPTGTSSPTLCADDAGGAYVFWDDFASTEMIVGQRVNALGNALWAAGGLGVGGSDLSDGQAQSIGDGQGGAIVYWGESPGVVASMRAQRVDGAGAAQWGASGTQVVSVANSDPVDPDVVPDGAGGAYFMWADARNGGGTGGASDIFAQRVGPAGGVDWAAGGVAATTSGGGRQDTPTGALDGAGGLLVAWLDERQFDTGIYAQRFTSLGARQLAAGGATAFASPGVQIGQLIIQTDAGGAFVFGNEKRNGQWDIRGRMFNADGTPAGPGVAICLAAGHQTLDAAIDDGSGGAIVAWTDRRAGGEDIYVQRVDASGAPQWTADGVAICVAGGPQQRPRMISDGAGGAILAWQDGRQAGNPDIYAQRVNASGLVQWTANGVPVCNDLNPQQDAVLAADGAGGAIVAWSDLRHFTFGAFYAQRLNNLGTGQWTPNGENVLTLPALSFGRAVDMVATTSNNSIVLVNQVVVDFMTGDFTHVLRAQRIDGAGAEQWGAAGIAVCDASSLTGHEAIVHDGGGGAIIAWSDTRNGPFDIFAQWLDNAGNAQWAADGVAVCDVAGWQHLNSVTRDPSGALFLAWTDHRSGQGDIYADLITTAGTSAWTADGTVVCDVARGQYFVATAPYKAASPARFLVAWTDNRAGDARYTWLQRLDASGASVWTADGVVRATLALASASAASDRVSLVWYASEPVAATVYRRVVDGEWHAVGGARTDGTGRVLFDDLDVLAGTRYGYRLGVRDGDGEFFAGEVWVEVPTGLTLALHGLTPNPAVDDLVVSFALPSGGPARLELLDLAGRRVLARELSGLGPGRHALRLEGARPPAGVYFIRLTHSGRSVVGRAAVVR